MAANDKPIMILSPALEAQQLLDDATNVVALKLASGIAGLGYPVGLGVAPHPTACRAAADRICKKFAGAVLAAVEFEREIARQAAENPAALPSDVIALVHAGRALMDADYDVEARRGLDRALEAFASRVCYDDEGGSLPEAHANPHTCGEDN